MDQAEFKKLKKLIEPVQTADELNNFLIDNWKIKLPWDEVDNLSTSSSLKFVWQVYKFMLTGIGCSTHVVASSRNGGKTLTSAMVQFFAMVHFRRDSLHLAATIDQSYALIKYIDKFLRAPELEPYTNTDNVRQKLLKLPANDFTLKEDASLQVATATKKGVNSQRSSCFDGKTEVLVYRNTPRKNNKQGGYKICTMSGLHSRLNNNEEIYAVSVNNKTGNIEKKRITKSIRSQKLHRLKFKTESGKEIRCTSDHLLTCGFHKEITYKRADSFKIGDFVLSKKTGSGNFSNLDKIINKHNSFKDINISFEKKLISIEDVLIGSLLGDGCVYKRRLKSDGSGREYKGNAYFVMTKTPKVREYNKFIAEKLSEKFDRAIVDDKSVKSGYTGKYLDQIKCKAHPYLTELRNKWYPNGKKQIPRDLKLTWGVFAVWLMDDGNVSFSRISAHSFSDEDTVFLCEKINELLGFESATPNKETKKDKKYNVIDIHWPFEHFDKYLKLQNYIHEDYKYKNNRKPRKCKHCGGFYYFRVNTNVCDCIECKIKEYSSVIQFDKILSIDEYEVCEKSRDRYVYDITVEDNHNFFANQVLVHNCLTFDECDLTPQEILSEASFISDPSIIYKHDGTFEKRNPLFIYLSSRKTNEGPLQNLIDKAEQQDLHHNKNKKKRIKLHKWSMVDWMAKCPDKDHKPELGQIKAFMNTDTLETIWDEEQYNEQVNDAAKTTWNELNAYEGCKDCPAWIACQGRSVNQRCDSFMLRDIEFIGDVLRSVGDTSAIIAQALNWKPETKGIVFKDFSYRRHVRDPIEFYSWVTFGERFNPLNLDPKKLEAIIDERDNCSYAILKAITPTKIDIFEAMKKHGWTMISGVDWGYEPDPAVCVILGYHKKLKKCAILHTEAQTGYSNHVWAEYCCENIYPIYPIEFVAPDQADPSSVTYFKAYGVRSLGKKQKPKKIITGVAFLRSLMWNPHTSEYNFCVLNDSFHFDSNGIVESPQQSGNALVIHEMTHWTHAKDPLGRWKMDKFDEEHNNHSIDAIRYALHPFTLLQNINYSTSQEKHSGSLQARIYAGDKDAERKAREMQEVRKQFADHMSDEFGLNGIFRPHADVLREQERAIREAATKRGDEADDKKGESKRSGGIKFVI